MTGSNIDRDDDFLPIIYNDKSITFALDENDFKEFIVKLLGKPEVIESSIHGTYNIDFNSFQDISHQIDNIVCEMNDASLAEFTAELFFDNDSSIRFNSIASFLSYKETRQIICTGFNFTWIYLIKFKSEHDLQKQEISIYSDSLDKSSSEKEPKIYCLVRSTILNWGIIVSERIKTLLELNCLMSFPFQKIRRKIASVIDRETLQALITLGASFSLVSLMIVTLMERILPSSNNTQLKEIFEKTTQSMSDSEKLDYLVLIFKTQFSPKDAGISIAEIINSLPLFFIFIMIIFAVFILVKLIAIPNWKFIIFTEKSAQEKKKKLDNRKQLEKFGIISILVSIVLSVCANYIFGFLTGSL